MDEGQPALTFKEALILVGGISAPSKMPWICWSTSAFDCKVGSKLREVAGSTCSSCYALKGNYRFKNVKEAHNRRLEALKNPRFAEAFIIVINSMYERTRSTYVRDGKVVKENRVRWHDSGDIQSLEHLKIINEIALATPQTDHWLPTREYGIVNAFLKEGNEFAPNLTVRMSAIMIGDTFDKRPMGLPFSTVGVSSSKDQCTAPAQEGKCLDCRACWDKDTDVNYLQH